MIINGIDTKDISVVVQGAVDKINTPKCLKSIRKYLPDAEIILSTWEGTDVSDLDYDKVLLNKDPGAQLCDPVEGRKNNVNRQIISTINGLKTADKHYALKMRSDIILESNKFLSYYKKYNKLNINNKIYDIFKEKILIPVVWTREKATNEGKTMWQPYHTSDWMMFGLNEDIFKLYDVPLMSEEDACYYYLIRDREKFDAFDNGLCQQNWRYTPEQYFLYSCLKKAYPNTPNFENKLDYSEKHMEIYHDVLVDNFIVINKDMWCFTNKKHDLDFHIFHMFNDIIKYSDYLKLLYSKSGRKNFFVKSQLIRISELRHAKKNMKLIDDQSDKDYKLYKSSNVKQVSSLIDVDFSKYSNVKVVSFDIFNTLLFRHSAPDWISTSFFGLYMSMLLKPFFNETSIETINRLRDQFVTEIYKKNKSKGLDDEYNLSDVIEKILKYYGISEDYYDELIKKVLENEIHRELDTLYVNPDAESVLETAKNVGFRIIAVSDMYLPQKIIKDILNKLHIGKYFDYVYVSCEYGMRKKGKFFDCVCKQEKIKYSQMLHIGDDIFNDVIPSIKKGITPIHYNNKTNIENKQKIEAIYLQNSFPNFLEDKFEINKKDDALNLCASYFGLDFCNFTFTFMRDCYLRNIKKIFFLSRDGNLFKYLYDKLFMQLTIFSGLPNIETKIISLSRKDSACLIDIALPANVIERANRVNPPACFNILHILGCFGLDLTYFTEEIQYEIQKNVSDRNYFVEHYFDYFFPLIEKRQKTVIENLNKKDFFGNDNFAIVDIGWGGTTQRDIQQYIESNHMPCSCYGFYYGKDGRAADLADLAVGYHDAGNLLWGYSFIEFLVKNYTDLDEKNILNKCPTPNLDKTYLLNQKIRKHILTMTKTFSDVVNKYNLTTENVACFTKSKVLEYIHNPPYELIKQIEDVKFSLDRRHDDQYISLVETVENRFAIDSERKTAQWLQGSAVLSNISDKHDFISGLRNFICRHPKLKSMVKYLLVQFNLLDRFR